MAKKVAIIEDEPELAALLEYNLSRQGLATRILTGSDEQAEPARIWDFPSLAVVKKVARARVYRALSESERERFGLSTTASGSSRGRSNGR